jgi:hypothetical protein
MSFLSTSSILVSIYILSFSSFANAESAIYRFINKDGSVLYTDDKSNGVKVAKNFDENIIAWSNKSRNFPTSTIDRKININSVLQQNTAK